MGAQLWLPAVALARESPSLRSAAVQRLEAYSSSLTCPLPLAPLPVNPRRSIEKQLSDAPIVPLLQACLLSREGKAKEADAALAAMAGRGDAARAAEAQLMRAQLAAAGGDAQQALTHLSVSMAVAWLGCSGRRLGSSGLCGQPGH